MIGTIRWNIGLGITGASLTFVISVSNNVWLTTISHSLYSFFILFFAVFAFRWFLGSVVGLKGMKLDSEPDAEAMKDVRGAALDMTTPDDGKELEQMLKDSAAPNDAFEPLQPTRVVKKNNWEDLAGAIRRMSED